MKNACPAVVGRLLAMLMTAAICIGGGLLPEKAAIAVPICIDDLCVEVPTARDYSWQVRAADFNNNGSIDLYVSGGYMTYTAPFLIIQLSQQQFVIADPTPAQHAQARALAPSTLNVYREELNNDTFLDFWIENVDQVIPGVQELAVLTGFDDGSTAQRVLAVTPDGELDVLIDNIEFVLNNATELINLYNGQTCFIRTVYVPYQVYDPFYDMYVLRWIPVSWEECYPNRDHPIFSGDLGVFCGGMSTSFAANGGEAGARHATVEAARTGQIILDHTIRPAVERTWAQAGAELGKRLLSRQAAKRVAIMLVLGTGGAAIAVGVAWTAYELYVFYKETSAERQRARSRRRDALVGVARVPAESYDPAKDPYKMKESCKPWDNVAAEQKAPSINDGSSKRLSDNLKIAGCECPPRTQAHHMFKKRGGEQAGNDLRQCLDAAGIDIDASGNGVCLPIDEADEHILSGRTRIASHQGAGLERYEYYSGLARECVERTKNLSTQEQKRAAVRQLLDEVRHSLHNWRVLQ